MRSFEEDEDGSRTMLWGLIHQRGDVSEARCHLRAFDDAWWLDEAASSGDDLGFDILFV